MFLRKYFINKARRIGFTQYEGLHPPYELNRPLTKDEINNQLHQDQELAEPKYVKENKKSKVEIKISDYRMLAFNISSFNYTYIEFFDTLYFLKPFVVLQHLIWGITFFSITLMICIWLYFYPYSKEFSIGFGFDIRYFFILFGLSMTYVFSLLSLPGIFNYQYKPIRFNRKNKKVYFFKNNSLDGFVCVPWDQIFFTVGERKHIEGEYFPKYTHSTFDLRAHILNDDKSLVIDTFAIGEIGNRSIQWKLIQYYMKSEEPDFFNHKIKKSVFFSKKNTIHNGELTWCYSQEGDSPYGSFIAKMYGIRRYIILGLNKRPIWQDAVEKECQIEPNDPYQLDEPIKMENPKLWVVKVK